MAGNHGSTASVVGGGLAALLVAWSHQVAQSRCQAGPAVPGEETIAARIRHTPEVLIDRSWQRAQIHLDLRRAEVVVVPQPLAQALTEAARGTSGALGADGASEFDVQPTPARAELASTINGARRATGRF